jgi:hypothetical protein
MYEIIQRNLLRNISKVNIIICGFSEMKIIS